MATTMDPFLACLDPMHMQTWVGYLSLFFLFSTNIIYKPSALKQAWWCVKIYCLMCEFFFKLLTSSTKLTCYMGQLLNIAHQNLALSCLLAQSMLISVFTTVTNSKLANFKWFCSSSFQIKQWYDPYSQIN